METILLKGKAVPKFDHALVAFLGVPEVEAITDGSIRQFGIENGDGEVYRIVGAESEQVYDALIGRLRNLHYRIEPLGKSGFDKFRAVARMPPGL
ncbi:hypothetical protein [Noviherbaspirillum soli]|uniref:hypothetical protein n=1 Tax=Noviherbaspirillum soli TaxID=1064518 RepID=UPI00188A68DB|nr:hypothetical protein [Noviherbaspirillum soli]